MNRLAMSAVAGCAAITTVTAPSVSSASATPSATPSAGAAVKPAAVKWGTCSDERLRKGHAQCATVAVPLDYAKPTGRKISLAVSRIKATAAKAKQQGPLLLNPGGPGGSGLRLPLYLDSALPSDVRATYDLIGFDPRGVGDSSPALSCDPNLNVGPRPDYEPGTDSASSPLQPNEVAWLARSEAYADACNARFGWLLPHLTTVNSVRDMDSIRQALGATKLNYYGFSYGTYLGQVYATMFPDKVRRFVFDGNVDPRNVWYDAQLEQDEAFEAAIHKFFGWVADHDEAYDLGETEAEVAEEYAKAQDELREAPVGKVGPAEWTDVFLPAGYSQELWPEIAGAFADWVAGDTKPVQDMWDETAEVGDDNGFAMYVAVQCVDAPWPTDYATWRKDGFATAEKAPFETWGNVWFNTPCMFWHAPQGTPPKVDGSKAPAPLLVNTTLDGATPFSGALEVRRRFPTAALVAEVGNTTHANSLAGNACVDKRVFDYLRSGALPTRRSGDRADVECAASPLPKPASVLPALPGSAAAERLALVTAWSRARG